MTTTAVARNERAAWDKVLVAATVDTVTFVNDPDVVRITNETGTAIIYITTDGTDPTVGGAKCYRVPATAGASIDIQSDQDLTTVKLISAGTPTYSVERS